VVLCRWSLLDAGNPSKWRNRGGVEVEILRDAGGAPLRMTARFAWTCASENPRVRVQQWPRGTREKGRARVVSSPGQGKLKTRHYNGKKRQAA
jgi:hypothetical protein